MGHVSQHFPPCPSAQDVQPCALRSPRYTRAGLPHVLREGGLQHVLQRVGLWPAPMAQHHRLPPGFPPPPDRHDARIHLGMALAAPLRSPLHPAPALASAGVGVAVSGGVDSMALALTAALMQRAQQSQQQQQGEGGEGGAGGLRVVAMVVDHALRPGSAHEAMRTVAWLSLLGLQAVLLTCHWPHGPPPPSRLQQDARAQRYELLQRECEERRLGVLMTAHHGNDQAELLLLRLARCSGMDGLACMPLLYPLPPSPPPLLPCLAPVHAHGSMGSSTGGTSGSNGRSCTTGLSSSEGIVVLRPLLGVCKQQLVAVCEAHAQPWIDDPSNASSLFLRNRIRHALAALPPHHASAVHAAAHGMSEVAAAMRSHRLTAARRLAAAALLPASVSPSPPTSVTPTLLASGTPVRCAASMLQLCHCARPLSSAPRMSLRKPPPPVLACTLLAPCCLLHGSHARLRCDAMSGHVCGWWQGGAVHISIVELLAPHWWHDTRMHVLSLLLQVPCQPSHACMYSLVNALHRCSPPLLPSLTPHVTVPPACLAARGPEALPPAHSWRACAAPSNAPLPHGMPHAASLHSPLLLDPCHQPPLSYPTVCLPCHTPIGLPLAICVHGVHAARVQRAPLAPSPALPPMLRALLAHCPPAPLRHPCATHLLLRTTCHDDHPCAAAAAGISILHARMTNR
ncbi:unnamed protein product [Closterium sp. Naga37s-1]|nr:unnamed protein product [Closterium sp. Naga37s-1]